MAIIKNSNLQVKNQLSSVEESSFSHFALGHMNGEAVRFEDDASVLLMHDLTNVKISTKKVKRDNSGSYYKVEARTGDSKVFEYFISSNSPVLAYTRSVAGVKHTVYVNLPKKGTVSIKNNTSTIGVQYPGMKSNPINIMFASSSDFADKLERNISLVGPSGFYRCVTNVAPDEDISKNYVDINLFGSSLFNRVVGENEVSGKQSTDTLVSGEINLPLSRRKQKAVLKYLETSLMRLHNNLTTLSNPRSAKYDDGKRLIFKKDICSFLDSLVINIDELGGDGKFLKNFRREIRSIRTAVDKSEDLSVSFLLNAVKICYLSHINLLSILSTRFDLAEIDLSELGVKESATTKQTVARRKNEFFALLNDEDANGKKLSIEEVISSALLGERALSSKVSGNEANSSAVESSLYGEGIVIAKNSSSVFHTERQGLVASYIGKAVSSMAFQQMTQLSSAPGSEFEIIQRENNLFLHFDNLVGLIDELDSSCDLSALKSFRSKIRNARDEMKISGGRGRQELANNLATCYSYYLNLFVILSVKFSFNYPLKFTLADKIEKCLQATVELGKTELAVSLNDKDANGKNLSMEEAIDKVFLTIKHDKVGKNVEALYIAGHANAPKVAPQPQPQPQQQPQPQPQQQPYPQQQLYPQQQQSYPQQQYIQPQQYVTTYPVTETRSYNVGGNINSTFGNSFPFGGTATRIEYNKCKGPKLCATPPVSVYTAGQTVLIR